MPCATPHARSVVSDGTPEVWHERARHEHGVDLGAVARPSPAATLHAVANFLFKTEPSEYAFADLEREGRTVWSGISNATALIHLRTVRKGDTVVVYHSGKEKQAVAIARAASDPYPDPKLGDPKRVVVDLAPVRALRQPVLLATFRADPVLKTTELVRISRLSVMPLSAAHLKQILKLGGA